MENIIFNELLSRGYSVDVGVVQCNSKGADEKQHQIQCEIDFVVNDGMNKYYIQSALSIDDRDKEQTEIRPFIATRDFFKKIIITKTRMKPWVDDNGIIHMGLYDFLLDENCLK